MVSSVEDLLSGGAEMGRVVDLDDQNRDCGHPALTPTPADPGMELNS